MNCLHVPHDMSFKGIPEQAPRLSIDEKQVSSRWPRIYCIDTKAIYAVELG